jgi:hypothetical protein
MSWLKCRACAAKDEEIKRLVWQIEQLHGQLARAVDRAFETASPGVVRRIEQKPSESKRPVIRVDTGLPGYEPMRVPAVEIE